ncbi:MAG: 3-dehydroquinate synthase [Candidatus Acididesulfobacter guangdongensis]|uniref:3-dehydroquinate synthase n=1 Tax=Acididesulfobacter guangdongensis TaxID=2597225 RepID=A0A519BEJ0_ACIG2|nr:MAG: 3-dehydroquinate synthase [Candidatus Acididesulfobacter guangdongensis]
MKIKVDLSHSLKDASYDILIDSNISIGEILKSAGIRKRVSIVTCKTVNDLYGNSIGNALKSAEIEPFFILLPDGESAKSIKYLSYVYDELIKNRFERSDYIIAFGGGVIGDIAGYASASYLRGVNFIQIPTTLLSDVDSSVGGKTGIDHPAGKNLIGAFYQPKIVIIDVDFLNSLDNRELINGFAEVIKYGAVLDRDLFLYLENNLDKIMSKDKQSLMHIIESSCLIKADIVNKDEREGGVRSVLNFGHSLGHAIETLYNYKTIKHGEAISIGMVFASKLSKELNLCSSETVNRLERLIENSGLPTEIPKFSPEEYINAMKLDKKVEDESIKFVLINNIGNFKFEKLDFAFIRKFLENII